MTRYFKVGVYTKREDYSKLAIRGIVFGSIWLAISLIVTAGWLGYVTDNFSSVQTTTPTLNQTTTNLNNTDNKVPLETKIMALGILSIILIPILFGVVVGYWIANFVYRLLGLHKWNVYTCRCCGKKVGEHERIMDDEV